jgi:hypothetical protein
MASRRNGAAHGYVRLRCWRFAGNSRCWTPMPVNRVLLGEITRGEDEASSPNRVRQSTAMVAGARRGRGGAGSERTLVPLQRELAGVPKALDGPTGMSRLLAAAAFGLAMEGSGVRCMPRSRPQGRNRIDDIPGSVRPHG